MALILNFFAQLFYSLLIIGTLSAQNPNPMKVYLIPGQGADARLYDKLQLDEKYMPVILDFFIPEENWTLKDYAALFAAKIDTSEPFALIGVSLGGMICSELCEIVNPEKVILISSAKSRNELPKRYRFMSQLPINKLVPQQLYKTGAQIAQPLVEPDRKQGKEIFVSMLKDKDPAFLKRTVNMIINWKKQKHHQQIVHIHGDNDHTLPLKNVQADYVIKGGSHMMVYTRGEEISAIVNGILAH